MKVKRIRNARGKGLMLRQELLSAASSLLKSGKELTLRSVARDVGVSAPSVYAHFADKDALIIAVLTDRFDELIERGRAAVGDRTGSDRLVARAMAYVEFGLERSADYSLMFEGRGLEQLDKPVAHVTRFADDLLEDLRQSRSTGDSYDLKHVLALWSALHGLVSLRNHKPFLPWQSWRTDVERLVDYLTRFEGPSVTAGSPPRSSSEQRP